MNKLIEVIVIFLSMIGFLTLMGIIIDYLVDKFNK
jgi:hypothetical protein